MFLAFLAYKIHRNAIVSVFVDDTNHREVDFVDLELRLILELITKRTFPLRPGNGIKAAVLQALKAFITQRRLDVIKLAHGLLMNLCQFLLV